MSMSSLAKKLRIQKGQRVLLLNAPSGYLETLGELPDDVEVSVQSEGTYDFVQVFVKDSAEFEGLVPQALRSVVYDGLLWISYPKKSSGVESDLSRDRIWGMTTELGIRPVMQVAVDEVWSALRFRPLETAQ